MDISTDIFSNATTGDWISLLGVGFSGLFAFLALGFAYYQYWKNTHLQKKILRIEQENQDIQKQALELDSKSAQLAFRTQKRSDNKEKVVQQQKRKTRKNDLEHYREYIYQQFRYLVFTGLNAILQSPIPLENIYVKLRARPKFPLFSGKSSETIPQSIEEFGEWEDVLSALPK